MKYEFTIIKKSWFKKNKTIIYTLNVPECKELIESKLFDTTESELICYRLNDEECEYYNKLTFYGLYKSKNGNYFSYSYGKYFDGDYCYRNGIEIKSIDCVYRNFNNSRYIKVANENIFKNDIKEA